MLRNATGQGEVEGSAGILWTRTSAVEKVSHHATMTTHGGAASYLTGETQPANQESALTTGHGGSSSSETAMIHFLFLCLSLPLMHTDTNACVHTHTHRKGCLPHNKYGETFSSGKSIHLNKGMDTCAKQKYSFLLLLYKK